MALGRAYRDVGELTNMIGSREEALAVHQRTLGLFESLSRESPDEPEPRYEVGKSSNAIGGLLAATGRHADGLAAVDRARTILRRSRRPAWPTTGPGSSSPTPNIIMDRS